MSVERFIKAQKNTYEDALAEIKGGKKRSHWIWFIFPQIQGLGFSACLLGENCKYDGGNNRNEKEARA